MIDSNEYEVEKVVGMRVIDGVWEYEIKWKGYPHSYNTWETDATCNCQEAIMSFIETMPKLPFKSQLLKNQDAARKCSTTPRSGRKNTVSKVSSVNSKEGEGGSQTSEVGKSKTSRKVKSINWETELEGSSQEPYPGLFHDDQMNAKSKKCQDSTTIQDHSVTGENQGEKSETLVLTPWQGASILTPSKKERNGNKRRRSRGEHENLPDDEIVRIPKKCRRKGQSIPFGRRTRAQRRGISPNISKEFDDNQSLTPDNGKEEEHKKQLNDKEVLRTLRKLAMRPRLKLNLSPTKLTGSHYEDISTCSDLPVKDSNRIQEGNRSSEISYSRRSAELQTKSNSTQMNASMENGANSFPNKKARNRIELGESGETQTSGNATEENQSGTPQSSLKSPLNMSRQTYESKILPPETSKGETRESSTKKKVAVKIEFESPESCQGKSINQKSRFDLGMKVDKIAGSTVVDGEIHFLVTWIGTSEAEIVPAKVANEKCPQKVLEYYERIWNWRRVES
nr:Chromobox protein 5 [Hymenolepis microstoma]